MTDRVDVLGIGNAIVDILCLAQESDLQVMGLDKGMMTLVDDETVENLKKTAVVDSMLSGGSVANTMVHFSALGGRGQFIGKVAHDTIGDSFRQDMTNLEISFQTSSLETGSATGCCHIFVTPDAQRTMCTYLGASAMLTPEDLDEEAVSKSSIVLIEGYLWDSPGAVELIAETVHVAKRAQTKIALTLSDPMLVERHRNPMYDFVRQHVDILFANELEAQQLCQTDGWEDAQKAISASVNQTVITRGDKGSVAAIDGRNYFRAADTVTNVVDTTGAGDSYAAGYLYGITQNWPIDRCMGLGSEIAAATVSHMGGRLGTSN